MNFVCSDWCTMFLIVATFFVVASAKTDWPQSYTPSELATDSDESVENSYSKIRGWVTVPRFGRRSHVPFVVYDDLENDTVFANPIYEASTQEGGWVTVPRWGLNPVQEMRPRRATENPYEIENPYEFGEIAQTKQENPYEIENPYEFGETAQAQRENPYEIAQAQRENPYEIENPYEFGETAQAQRDVPPPVPAKREGLKAKGPKDYVKQVSPYAVTEIRDILPAKPIQDPLSHIRAELEQKFQMPQAEGAQAEGPQAGRRLFGRKPSQKKKSTKPPKSTPTQTPKFKWTPKLGRKSSEKKKSK